MDPHLDRGSQPDRRRGARASERFGLVRLEIGEDHGQVLRVGQEPDDIDVFGVDEREPTTRKADNPPHSQPWYLTEFADRIRSRRYSMVLP